MCWDEHSLCARDNSAAEQSWDGWELAGRAWNSLFLRARRFCCGSRLVPLGLTCLVREGPYNVPPKCLAKLCPPGGTLRSPTSCCLAPRSLPPPWAQHFL